MGLLAKMALEVPKGDFPFTVVQIKSLEDGKCTNVRIIDALYSQNGEVIKEEELPSFEGEWALIYNAMLQHYITLATSVDMSLRAGRIC